MNRLIESFTSRSAATAGVCLLVALSAGSAHAWSASGTVKSKAGAALSGVTVTVQDSAAIATNTDASGAFQIGSSTSIRGLSDVSDWSLAVDGREILVRTPAETNLEFTLLDGSGRILWSAGARAQGGVAQATLPEMRPGAAYLRIRPEQGAGTVLAVTTGPEGLRVATHLVAPRALAGFPVLKFHKSGYRDTTYAMTAATQTALAIVLGDTGVPPTTCPTTKLAAGDQNKTISVKGVSRKYILHVPSAYTGTTPVPLVVDYHPIMGTAAGQESGTTYKSVTDKEGVISLYPDGLASPLNNGQAWNVQGCCTTADDTSFVRAMVAEVKTLACIDPKRVYATGFSMGGGMTHYSACHLSDIFAAGAPAAFDLTEQNAPGCKPVHPITMIMFRGTADGTVAYAGGHSAVVPNMAIDFLGAKGTFQKWAELNKCTGSPSAEDANGCSTYSTCEGGVQVTLCTKQGGGHEQGNGALAWPILKKYTLP